MRGAVRLVPTKLHPPVIDPVFVRRPRLSATFDIGARVTTVVAPAGFGKSVATAQWVDDLDPPIAWLTLDRSDQMPALFWRYVAGCLDAAIPGLGSETIAALDQWTPQALDIVSVLLAELADSNVLPAVLVLDDMHLVMNAEIFDQLGFFIERCPDQLRFVLISRIEPPLPLARWHAGGQLAGIGAEDLLLTADEAWQALVSVPDSNLRMQDADFLIRRAEGWPAILRLAALSTRGHHDGAAPLLEEMSTRGPLVDYVVAEVLAGLPEHERGAVLALSLLDDIDGERCAALTGVEDGEALLSDLLRRGLPITAMDSVHLTVRFHHLFRELLRAELHRSGDFDIRDLHRKAARAEQAADDTMAAIRHLLAAQENDAALELVVGPVWTMYESGRIREAVAWLAQIPDAVVAHDWRRMLALSAVLTLVGRIDDAARWNERATAVIGGAPTGQTELVLCRMLVHMALGNTVAVRAEFERLPGVRVDRMIHTDQTVRRIVTVMAIASLYEGRLAEADRWVSVAATSSMLPDRPRLVGIPARRAWLALERGFLDEAEMLADTSLGHAGADHRGGGHAILEAMVVKARLATERLSLDAAESMAERAMELAAELGAPSYQALAGAAVVGVVEAQDGPEQAIPTAFRLTRAVDPAAAAARGRWALILADLLARCGQLDDAARYLAGLPDSPGQRLVRARIALGRHHYEELQQLLDVDGGWSTRQSIEAQLLRHSSRPADTGFLYQALELGATAGFAWTYLREGPNIIAALSQLVGSRPLWNSSSLAHHLRRVGPSPSTPDDALFEGLSQRELEVLQFIPTHMPQLEIASELFVSVNTVRTHVRAIYRKLGVASRSEAVRRANELGLIKITDRMQ